VAACGAGNPLLGKWENDEEGIMIEFKDDNTFTISSMDVGVIEGTYKLSGDQVTLSAPEEEEEDTVMRFDVSGDTLTFLDPVDNVDIIQFTRMK
jgi:hypothetical protein